MTSENASNRKVNGKNILKWTVGVVALLSVLFAVCVFKGFPFKADDPVTITIAFTNDIHGNVDRIAGNRWGYPAMSSFIKKLEAEDHEMLLVDAGDTFSGGGALANFSSGEVIVKIMNAVGYDLMTIGNHDFNYGYERLQALIEMADFPVINANVKKDGKPVFTPYITKQIKGVKVAFIGLLTDSANNQVNASNKEHLIVEPPEKVLAEYIPLLRANADVVVVLGHLGGDLNRVAAVGGVDMIIDGHDHLRITDTFIKNTKIVSSGEYLERVGVTNLIIKHGRILNSPSFEHLHKTDFLFQVSDDDKDDENILSIIKEEKDKNSAKMVKVADLPFALNGSLTENRLKSTMISNFVTDVILEKSGADIALINGGMIRNGLNMGEVIFSDVVTIIPYANRIQLLSMTGKDIKSALNHGLKNYPESFGGFLQIAGAKVYVNCSDICRVDKVVLSNGKIVSDKNRYKVAVTDFLVNGGDGHTDFMKKEFLRGFGDILKNISDSLSLITKKDESRLKEDRIIFKGKK